MSSVFAALALAFTSAASAGPDPIGVFWKEGSVSLARITCTSDIPDDLYCRAIELRDHGRRRVIGTHYQSVRLLWTRRGAGPGPDALVLGDDGGSGGLGDLFAVTAGRSAVVTKYNGERLDDVRPAPSSAALHVDLPFDIGYFNGAPHAGVTIVPIPTIWADGDFSADIGALEHSAISARDLQFRELAMNEELRAWQDASDPTPGLYPPEARSGTPVTVQALADLMLTGRADQARALLHRAWPTTRERLDVKLKGEEGFWRALCRTMVRHPLWRRLRLDRLPHSDIIKAGAA